jgi:uncharacterized membrane protein
MNFPDQFLPTIVAWPSAALAALAVGYAIHRAPWGRLGQGRLMHVWLGMCVALMAVWSIKAGIKPGLNFHLLGATLLTLMFGPWLALTGLAVVLAAVTLAGHAGWGSFGVNLLLMAVLPVGASHVIYALADRRLPNHLFIYIFIDAFASAGGTMLLSGMAATLLLALCGIYAGTYLTENFLPYYILMGWSEALLTGMAVTLMTAFRPDWLATFDDARYLGRR